MVCRNLTKMLWITLFWFWNSADLSIIGTCNAVCCQYTTEDHVRSLSVFINMHKLGLYLIIFHVCIVAGIPVKPHIPLLVFIVLLWVGSFFKCGLDLGRKLQRGNRNTLQNAPQLCLGYSPLTSAITRAIIVSPNIMNMRDFVLWIARRRNTC